MTTELQRIPEPRYLTPQQEALEYHAMDHGEVNQRFVVDLRLGPVGPSVMDLGCGTGAIAIELCRQLSGIEVIGIDAAIEMLEIARREVEGAGLRERIRLHHADARTLSAYADATVDTVISNSLLHHLDIPQRGLETAIRLIKPGGRLFIRDLARPSSVVQVEQLVKCYTGEESVTAQQLFRQSLHAAMTLEEIRDIAGGLGIQAEHVQMTSDRHWTLDWTRP